MTSIPNVVAVWHREHVHFRSLLHLLQREVGRFNAGERPNYELMLDIITYLREAPAAGAPRHRPGRRSAETGVSVRS